MQFQPVWNKTIEFSFYVAHFGVLYLIDQAESGEAS
jgi:hypothetical protein